MLDNHGKLAIAEIVAYSPAILFCLWNNFAYGFRLQAGWIYLIMFCGSKPKSSHAWAKPQPLICRVTVKLGGATTIIDIEKNNDVGLIPTATVLNTIALSPLLGATLSFLNPRYVLLYLCTLDGCGG